MWKKPLKNNSGQMMLEYAVLLAVVLLALAFIGVHMRNAFTGKARDGADAIGLGEVYRPQVDTIAAGLRSQVTSTSSNR
jgi:uncharacterized protein (UPF0333 family)